MKITYDKAVDAAYVYLVDRIDPGGVARTLPCEPTGGGQINLDFDEAGHLLGLEILNASRLLAPEAIANAASGRYSP